MKKYTPEEIKKLEIKAKKWDELEAKIAKLYPITFDGPPEQEGDLGTIGELSAIAFGFL